MAEHNDRSASRGDHDVYVWTVPPGEGDGHVWTVPLGDRDVHVWTVPLRAEVDRDQGLAGVLSGPELTAMERFAFAEDRRRYRLSHVALRWILSAYVADEPGQIQFRSDALGKPSVVGADVQFSMAHAGDVALVGVGRGRALGVDLEQVRELPDAETLKRAAFTARERAHLATTGRASDLLLLWTRKEAVVKATGEGLQRAPRDFEVLDPHGLAGWRIVDLVPAPGYVGAAVIRDDVVALLTPTFGWGSAAQGD